MNNPKLMVSEDSRTSGRVKPEDIAEKLEQERDSLIKEKKQIEAALSDLNHARQSEAAKVSKQRLGHAAYHRAKSEMDIKHANKKRDLVRRKTAIEERMADIKIRLGRGPAKDGVEAVLLRIESLLQTVINKME